MNGVWETLYRMASWACTGMAWTNAAIVFWDGCTGQLQTQYRMVTFLVALLFVLIGGLVLGLERILGKIRRWYRANPGARPEAEIAGTWRTLHVLLTVVIAFAFAVMGGGLVAMIARLEQGFKIFG